MVVFARSAKGPGFEPRRATIFHLLQMAPNINNPLWRGGLVCMPFIEGYRKFVDFPTGNSWTNLKSPGKCVTGVGFRWRIVGDMICHNFSPVTFELCKVLCSCYRSIHLITNLFKFNPKLPFSPRLHLLNVLKMHDISISFASLHENYFRTTGQSNF